MHVLGAGLMSLSDAGQGTETRSRHFCALVVSPGIEPGLDRLVYLLPLRARVVQGEKTGQLQNAAQAHPDELWQTNGVSPAGEVCGNFLAPSGQGDTGEARHETRRYIAYAPAQAKRGVHRQLAERLDAQFVAPELAELALADQLGDHALRGQYAFAAFRALLLSAAFAHDHL